ncbi:MAG: ribulose-phosphate 3-epimerase [FCB group bacterium]|nr:ribulose-phosphate 3-epimerase [FCB group bacterium]
MQKQRIISPSILSADFTNLTREIKRIEAAGVTRLHLDVMDGRFVPNITFGPMIVSAIAGLTRCHLECHLMIKDPSAYFEQFIKAGADTVIFHCEASADIAGDLQQLRDKGVRAGLSLKPDTDPDVLIPYLDLLDYVLVMSVYPGFGGQEFISETLINMRKIVELRAGRPFLIGVDGGVNLQTIRQVYETGIDVAIVGSGFFGAGDLQQRHRDLLNA